MNGIQALIRPTGDSYNSLPTMVDVFVGSKEVAFKLQGDEGVRVITLAVKDLCSILELSEIQLRNENVET